MSREAMQQALDALSTCLSEHGHRCNRCDSEVDPNGEVVAALRAALDAPQGEPVALTDDDLLLMVSETAGSHWCDHAHVLRFARAIERAHKIGGAA